MQADAIVVLGCKVHPDGAPSASLARRIELAARAFRAEVAPRVIVSGGRQWGPHTEAVVMGRELLLRGVPQRAVQLELYSLSTAENCWFTHEILVAAGGRRVFVATCDWHLPRAARNFRRLGVDVCLPPPAWMRTPAPSLRRLLKERVNVVLDWCMMPRARHG